MASKSKWKHEKRALAPEEIKARVHQALHEGRTQQALELARNLFKQDRSPAHLELVQKATLARARQLRSQGNLRDAGTVLSNAAELGGQAFAQDVALEMARCGAVRQALRFLDRIEDAQAKRQIIGHAADSALRLGGRGEGAAGQGLLPQSLQGQLNLVRQAFSQLDNKQDGAVRAALQGIGLQSPFLDWKLLLRGFLAYYQNDDARALENWQRLDPDRLPARLAAPFRWLIDKNFQQAQPPATQQALRNAADRLQGSGIMPALRSLRTTLLDEDKLPDAFRQVETILPAFRQMYPAMAPRLANIFYWAIIHDGLPEDKQRFLRVFGPPADDPLLLRMDSLAQDGRRNLLEARMAWQEFDKWLQTNPAWGPQEQRQRARALIWCHLGKMSDGMPQMPEILRRLMRRLKKEEPKVSAEECYRQSLQLAPDLLEVHEALFQHFRKQEKSDQAIQAGKELLQRFPEHVATLEALGDLCQEKGKHAESLTFFQGALEVNPLERRLRSKVSFVYLLTARILALASRFDEARAAYQSALNFEEPAQSHHVLAKWAACELKAGNQPRAEELIQQARARARHPIYATFYLVIESARLKLAKAVKDRFGRELSDALAQPPVAEIAVALLEIAAVHEEAGVDYRGQKSHQKKVLTYLGKALPLSWTEEQLEKICTGLLEIQPGRLFDQFSHKGMKNYPANPVFFIREAERNLDRDHQVWHTEALLNRAQKLARDLPPGDRQQRLLDEIHQLQNLARPSGMPQGFPPLDTFEELLDPFFGADDDDDDY